MLWPGTDAPLQPRSHTCRAVQLRPQDARMWNAMGHCYQQEQVGAVLPAGSLLPSRRQTGRALLAPPWLQGGSITGLEVLALTHKRV